jgi:hypothetical protein
VVRWESIVGVLSVVVCVAVVLVVQLFVVEVVLPVPCVAA